ncbi:MAG: hypothetical protein DRI39_00575 [Chloroflexi bacterium]|nr:MAG: hypothetical protein DRI39_00575 [Chloroflexota bacterium]
METAIVAIICVALIVLGGMTMSQGFLSSVDTATLSLDELGDRDAEIMRTEISALTATWSSLTNTLEVSLSNTGQVKLASFSKWDVIVQYYTNSSYSVQYLTYTNGTLGSNEWKKEGIYQDSASKEAEVFDPDILNPAEEIIIQAKLDPPVGYDSTNLVVVCTPNGVPATKSFAGPSS